MINKAHDKNGAFPPIVHHLQYLGNATIIAFGMSQSGSICQAEKKVFSA